MTQYTWLKENGKETCLLQRFRTGCDKVTTSFSRHRFPWFWVDLLAVWCYNSTSVQGVPTAEYTWWANEESFWFGTTSEGDPDMSIKGLLGNAKIPRPGKLRKV